MAKRSLESERRHKSSDQILQGYCHNQVAKKWAVQRVADGPQIDWGVLQIFGFYLNTNDMDYTATWKQRHRYESTITLAMTTKDRQCGPTDALIGLQQAQGRQNSYTPKKKEIRAKTIRRRIASEIGMVESKLNDSFRAIFFLFIIFTKLVATWTRTSRLSMAWTPKHSMARSPMARSPMGRSWLVWRFRPQLETVCAGPIWGPTRLPMERSRMVTAQTFYKK